MGDLRMLLGPRQLLVTLIGVCLYATISTILNYRPYPILYPITLRPEVAAPMLLGFMFGPLPGFLSGLVGAVISDSLSYRQLFLNWDLAMGLMGLITSIGFYKVKGPDRTGSRGIFTLMGLALLAILLSVGFAVIIDIFQFGEQATAIEFIPPAATYMANALLLLPISVIAYNEWISTNRHHNRQSSSSSGR